MIFVTTGTQKFQMDRIFCMIDELIKSGQIDDDVYAQIGNSNYLPSRFPYSRFLKKEEFMQKIVDCKLLISHGGVSTIIKGVEHNKPVIVVPRLAKYGEHVDDHQMEIGVIFSKLNYVLLYKGDSKEELLSLIGESKNHKFAEYKSQRENIVNIISGYINSIG